MAERGIERKVAELAGPVIESMGMELVDVEYRREPGGWVLRLYIDKEGGVTLDDCSEVSGEVGMLLEVEDVIAHSYNLEVSSPGLTRPLKKRSDFERFVGRVMKVKCFEPVGGRKHFVGINRGIDGDDVVVDLDGEEIRIAFSNIAKANLEFIQEG